MYTEEQAKRGAPLYARAMRVVPRSRADGRRDGAAARGGRFLAGWDGLTVGDLFERIRISMPQNAPGSLSGQQNADILAFMFSANNFPAGTTELSSQAMALKDIKFEAKKPGHDSATLSGARASRRAVPDSLQPGYGTRCHDVNRRIRQKIDLSMTCSAGSALIVVANERRFALRRTGQPPRLLHFFGSANPTPARFPRFACCKSSTT